MRNLELTLNEDIGVSKAPVQMKSNCGTLVIDDFGRQQIAPAELLNRWIVPLEKRYDYLGLASGRKFCVPFDQFIVFSTNLEPKDLVDEAFLRRIPYKIEIENPTSASFAACSSRRAKKIGLEFREAAFDKLIAKHYTQTGREMRFCHPRDLLHQAAIFCKFLKLPPAASADARNRGEELFLDDRILTVERRDLLVGRNSVSICARRLIFNRWLAVPLGDGWERPFSDTRHTHGGGVCERSVCCGLFALHWRAASSRARRGPPLRIPLCAERLLAADSIVYWRFDGWTPHRAAMDRTAFGEMMRGDFGKFLDYTQQLVAKSFAEDTFGQSLLAGKRPDELAKTQAAARQIPLLWPAICNHGVALGIEKSGSATIILPRGKPLYAVAQLFGSQLSDPVVETRIKDRMVLVSEPKQEPAPAAVTGANPPPPRYVPSSNAPVQSQPLMRRKRTKSLTRPRNPRSRPTNRRERLPGRKATIW